MGQLGNWTFRPCTIANSGNLSDAVEIPGYRVIGIISPAAWTAADIALQISLDGTNYKKVMDHAGEIIKFKDIQTAESRIHLLGATEATDVGGGMPFIIGSHVKLQSVNTADETDEAQGAERVLYVLMLPLGGTD